MPFEAKDCEDVETLLNDENYLSKLIETTNIGIIMKEYQPFDKSTNIQGLISKLSSKVVVTSYNNNSYTIDDIDFTLSPISYFDKRNGGNDTFINYYLSKNIIIKDDKQPLLIHKDESGIIHLIPELCVLTNISSINHYYCRMLPYTYQHIVTYSKIQDLESVLGTHFNNKKLLKQVYNNRE